MLNRLSALAIVALAMGVAAADPPKLPDDKRTTGEAVQGKVCTAAIVDCYTAAVESATRRRDNNAPAGSRGQSVKDFGQWKGTETWFNVLPPEGTAVALATLRCLYEKQSDGSCPLKTLATAAELDNARVEFALLLDSAKPGDAVPGAEATNAGTPTAGRKEILASVKCGNKAGAKLKTCQLLVFNGTSDTLLTNIAANESETFRFDPKLDTYCLRESLDQEIDPVTCKRLAFPSPDKAKGDLRKPSFTIKLPG